MREKLYGRIYLTPRGICHPYCLVCIYLCSCKRLSVATLSLLCGRVIGRALGHPSCSTPMEPRHTRIREENGRAWPTLICMHWLLFYLHFILSFTRKLTHACTLVLILPCESGSGRDGSQRRGNPISPQLRRLQTPDVARKQ